MRDGLAVRYRDGVRVSISADALARSTPDEIDTIINVAARARGWHLAYAKGRLAGSKASYADAKARLTAEDVQLK